MQKKLTDSPSAQAQKKDTTEKHIPAAVYICPYCSAEPAFDSAAALRDHIYTYHLWNSSSGHARIPIPLCMSIGGMETQEQVVRYIDQFVDRSFVCDIEIEEGILTDSYTRQLADAGFEMELNWQGLEYLEDNFDIHLNFIAEKKKRLEDITGKPVLGGRRRMSLRDKYTYDICDALGFRWYHIRPTATTFPYQVSAPYRAPGHDVVLCPRPPLNLWNSAGDVLPEPLPVDGGGYF